MKMLRISTSPPSNYDFSESEESSYYCDIYVLDKWLDIEIVASHVSVEIFPGLSKVEFAMVISEYLFDNRYKEIGVLLQFKNEDGELMYYGIDHNGNGRAEPAVNEAAWHIANAGQALADDHRLMRVSRTG